MNYPNFMQPSPEEIYSALRGIPNNPQGKQTLSGLVQQGKQTGSVEGGIAAALLNSYNKVQPPVQPPQGTVADQVVAQAQPAPQFNPQLMGIGNPALSAPAPQAAPQQMAAGGLVSFAEGGSTGDGGIWDASNLFGEGLNLEAPDTTRYQQDLAQPPEAPPATQPPTGHHTMDERVAQYLKNYGEMPDVAGSMMQRMQARRESGAGERALDNIISALGGYLTSYGSGQHRLGAGLSALAGTMGTHAKEQAEEDKMIDQLYAKSQLLPFETRKGAVDTLMGADTAAAKAAQAQALEMWKQGKISDTELRKAEMDIQKAYGVAGMQGATARDVATIGAESRETVARINQQAKAMEDRAKMGQVKASDAVNLINQMRAMGMDDSEIDKSYPGMMRLVRQGMTNQLGSPTSGGAWGQQINLGGDYGGSVYLSDPNED